MLSRVESNIGISSTRSPSESGRRRAILDSATSEQVMITEQKVYLANVAKYLGYQIRGEDVKAG